MYSLSLISNINNIPRNITKLVILKHQLFEFLEIQKILRQ